MFHQVVPSGLLNEKMTSIPRSCSHSFPLATYKCNMSECRNETTSQPPDGIVKDKCP